MAALSTFVSSSAPEPFTPVLKAHEIQGQEQDCVVSLIVHVDACLPSRSSLSFHTPKVCVVSRSSTPGPTIFRKGAGIRAPSQARQRGEQERLQTPFA